ncbi:protein Wnt-11b-1-like [Coccinella septempunctata]|uniref:protein Wnt-11b-1-like n=1 Tax=Coccinella septempunctata TaxID=41139 RepID=UPI001D08F40A|nr:protein Wnt-11b-1-like [Coccinella septempunctata]
MNTAIFFLLAVLLVDCAEGIRWLSLQHSNIHWNLSSANNNPSRGIRSGLRSPCGVARRRYGFIKIQAKLCRSWMETMPHVQMAATIAADTCQKIFADRRWNCSSITRAPYLMPDLTRATREQAFVYSLSSASLTYAMARACSSGALYHCTCAVKPTETPNENFQWGGCGDNLKWGASFAKRFIDNAEKYVAKKTREKLKKRDNSFEGEEQRKYSLLKTQMALINLHNNRVGRRVISESMTTQCKCHGVSGSCNIKTCWRALPSMVEIGRKLLQRYSNAKEVVKDVLPDDVEEGYKHPGTNQLIYLSKSPDYCTRDDKLGSLGTVGRQCNVTSKGPDSCRLLCCGRGYRTVVEEKIERCHCKYYYCCYVKCKVCKTTSLRYECS